MMINFKTTLAAAAMMALPMTASAATVEYYIDLSQDNYTFAHEQVNPGDMVRFIFTATENLKVTSFGLSGSGFIDKTEWQMFNPDRPIGGGTGTFEYKFGSGGAGFGGVGINDSQIYMAGESFTVEFTQPITSGGGASFTVSFPVAAVPVPAAGLLLLSALGGVAVLRRRKSVAA